MEEFIGKRIQVWCMNYIYSGTLAQVKDGFAHLANPQIVYETGPLLKPAKDAQQLPGIEWCVSLAAIESFGLVPEK